MTEYGCPVNNCQSTHSSQTAMLNHVRLTSDKDHDEMWRRIKNKAQEEEQDQQQEENENDEKPELSETFEKKYRNQDKQEKEENVTTLQTVENNSNNQSQEDSFERIENVEIEKLVENNIVESVEDGVEKLRSAKSNGYSQINYETGELA